MISKIYSFPTYYIETEGFWTPQQACNIIGTCLSKGEIALILSGDERGVGYEVQRYKDGKLQDKRTGILSIEAAQQVINAPVAYLESINALGKLNTEPEKG